MHDSREEVILVDESDRELGLAYKLEVHRKGLLHRAFSIMIWDRDHRLLLQKRSPQKYHSGALWSNACCGHPRPKERLEKAARRRLQEEMGLDCPLIAIGSLRYRTRLTNGMVEHELVHIFCGNHSGPVAANPHEVADWRWDSLSSLRRALRRHPDRFTPWFHRYVEAEWPLSRPLQ